MVGDINIHVDIALCLSHYWTGFSQSGDKPTHCFNYTLDLVLAYGIKIEHFNRLSMESSFIGPLFNYF